MRSRKRVMRNEEYAIQKSVRICYLPSAFALDLLVLSIWVSSAVVEKSLPCIAIFQAERVHPLTDPSLKIRLRIDTSIRDSARCNGQPCMCYPCIMQLFGPRVPFAAFSPCISRGEAIYLNY
ncbi:hypothetical protein N431DRAFT_118981 [Stipitochalara longipes BDJ]|nr:hypothetical protein N431DRAFT_118981 [Stipitochalara longipes BDJ]